MKKYITLVIMLLPMWLFAQGSRPITKDSITKMFWLSLAGGYCNLDGLAGSADISYIANTHIISAEALGGSGLFGGTGVGSYGITGGWIFGAEKTYIILQAGISYAHINTSKVTTDIASAYSSEDVVSEESTLGFPMSITLDIHNVSLGFKSCINPQRNLFCFLLGIHLAAKQVSMMPVP